MSQADVFFASEGNAWLKRNEDKLPIENDPVLALMGQLVGLGDRVLEIGCSNGWRLKQIKSRFGMSKLCGIDPSAKAIRQANDAIGQAKKKGIDARRGNASYLPWDADSFDVVIYGFCLYLCDRKDLFTIVREGDRVLKDGGVLIIHDFLTNYPCKNEYKHKKGVWSYKQDYSKLFTANPAYKELLTGSFSPETQTIALRKNIERGWPECAA